MYVHTFLKGITSSLGNIPQQWRTLIKNLILQQIRHTVVSPDYSSKISTQYFFASKYLDRHSEKKSLTKRGKKGEANSNPLEINLKSFLPLNPERIECLVKRSIGLNREIVISFPDICRESNQSRGSTFSFFLEELAKGHQDRFLFPLKWSNRQGPSASLLPSTFLSLRFRLDNGCLLITAQRSAARFVETNVTVS